MTNEIPPTAAAMVKALGSLRGSDPESAHSVADDLLLDWLSDSPRAGDREVAQAYRDLVKRSRWWATS